MKLSIIIFTILLLVPSDSLIAGPGLDLPISSPLRARVVEAPGTPANSNADSPRDASPPIFYGEEIEVKANSLVYVIDGSGSMVYPADLRLYRAQTPGVDSRWDVAKGELKKSIDGLASNLRFNLVKYSCSITICFKNLQKANATNKAAAKAWLDTFIPTQTGGPGISGGTGTGPAVAVALDYKENLNIILLTDGEPNCPWGNNSFNKHRRAIMINNTQGATIDVFGIAAERSHRIFCQAVASDSGGSYYDR